MKINVILPEMQNILKKKYDYEYGKMSERFARAKRVVVCVVPS